MKEAGENGISTKVETFQEIPRVVTVTIPSCLWSKAKFLPMFLNRLIPGIFL